MTKKYTVFVSSTYEDLRDERQAVMQALLEMDCIPCGMELFPAADEEQFEFIKRIIDDCDYYVLIIAGKYGSINQEGISYTELEFKYALGNNIPIISFIRNDIESLPNIKCEHDEEKIQKLNQFINEAKKKLCKYWTNKENLAGLVSLSMIQLIKNHPAVGWVRANLVSNEETLAKISQLYEENRMLKNNLDNFSISKFAISGNIYIILDFHVLNKNHDNFTRKMSLNDILKLIGMFLIEEKSKYEIGKRLCTIVGEEYLKEMGHEITWAIKENMPVVISEESLGEILLKLLSINYISYNHSNFSKSSLTKYILTELGRNVLLQLLEKRQ